jgi:1,2-diacylglycerol 3-alpha-glucosyltransferase
MTDAVVPPGQPAITQRPVSVVMVAACPFPVNYGTPGAIRELTVTLSEMGHDVHVVTYPNRQDLPVGQAKIHRVGGEKNPDDLSAGPSTGKIFLDLLMLRELCRVVRQEKIQIIHAHNYEGALIGLFAKLITGRPVVYNAVNLMSDELASYRFIRPKFLANWLGHFLDWFVPPLPDHIIAVTTELYQWLLEHGIKKEKLTMIPCGIRPAMFDHPDRNRFRQKYGIGDRPVVMYTGINSAFQRVDYLVRAFSIVAKEDPEPLLMIVSPLDNEPDLPASQALAKELGIEDRVLWIGPHPLSDLKDYLAAADVTVVPRPECPGHPIKLLNYMISGKPIVCFAGAAKGVTHLHDAFIVKDHDWQEMAQAILKLMREPELSQTLGLNARRTAIDNFDWEVLSRKVADIYKTLVPAERPSVQPAIAEQPK